MTADESDYEFMRRIATGHRARRNAEACEALGCDICLYFEENRQRWRDDDERAGAVQLSFGLPGAGKKSDSDLISVDK